MWVFKLFFSVAVFFFFLDEVVCFSACGPLSAEGVVLAVISLKFQS